MSYAPFAISHRELWLPEHIRGTQLPPFRGDAHALTLTGAQKRTTSDGVHFTGTATSNIIIAANAGQNAQAACHITIRFKLDTTFAAGAPSNFYLAQKLLAADNYLRVYLKALDGKLYWEQGNLAGGIQFTLTSTTVSWTAGTWYIVTVSLTGTPTQRLLVNGTVEDTDVAAAVATPNGGDIVIGSSSDGGVDGVVGTISWVVIGVGTTAATALTAAEEIDLSKGAPPPTAKVQHMLLLDEGMGVTAYDRGSLAVNGVLDSACTWAWGQVRQPVLSLDGINDRAVSAATVVNISGDLTIALVTKAGNTQDASISGNHMPLFYHADDNNRIYLVSEAGTNGIKLGVTGSGVERSCAYTTKPAIGDIRVYSSTITAAGVITLFVNGAPVAIVTGVGVIIGLATVYLGMYKDGIQFSNDKVLFAALIEGALTAARVKTYSKWLRDTYNLPIVI